jgi:hypothetical protein
MSKLTHSGQNKSIWKSPNKKKSLVLFFIIIFFFC